MVAKVLITDPVKADKLFQEFVTRLRSNKYDKQPSLNERAVWHVFGADPNCDMGGYHHEPDLGFYEGTFEDVARYAVTLAGFHSWGPGRIVKESPPTVTKIDTPERMRIAELQAKRKAAQEQLDEIERELRRVRPMPGATYEF